MSPSTSLVRRFRDSRSNSNADQIGRPVWRRAASVGPMVQNAIVNDVGVAGCVRAHQTDQERTAQRSSRNRSERSMVRRHGDRYNAPPHRRRSRIRQFDSSLLRPGKTPFSTALGRFGLPSRWSTKPADHQKRGTQARLEASSGIWGGVHQATSPDLRGRRL